MHPMCLFKALGGFLRLLMCGCRHTVVCSGVLGRKQQCWGADRTNKLVIKAAFVAGVSLNTLEALAQETRTKLNSILDNPSHPISSIIH